jgi:hypothetical protein
MISVVTDAIVNTLRTELPPLLQPGQIGLRSPSDMDEGCLLGVFPHSIIRDTRYQMSAPIRVDGGLQTPPLCAEIHFFVTSYIGRKTGLTDDYKILERVMQIWPDVSELSLANAFQPDTIPLPRIELLSPDADTVSKIWQFSNTSYRLSLFYKCAPVAIPSEKFKPVARVGAVDYFAESGE